MRGTTARHLDGMRGFTLIWFGQLVSLLGSGMTRFAITLWAWEKTGEATTLALAGFFAFAPGVFMSPLAGALVDRWDRRLAMMISDLAAGLSAVFIFLMLTSSQLEIWHIYAAGFFASIFESFQFPAWSAALSVMLPKAQYGRASGMQGLADYASGILAPVLASGLFVLIGFEGILLIDIVTFCFAISTLLLIHIPPVVVTEAMVRSRSGGLLHEVSYGFRYIFGRPSLLGLQLSFFGINLTATVAFVLLPVLVLSRTGNDETALGIVQASAGVGGVVGGLLLSIYGSPRYRVHGVLGSIIASSLLGQTVIGLGQALPVWMFGAFMTTFFSSILNASNQALWQAKVAPEVQGRVFAVRRLIAQVTAPVALLLAGPLADQVFGPALLPGGALVPVFGGLFGVGPGAGIGLLFAVTGLMGVAVGLAGYSVSAVRNAETLLPDHSPGAAAS